MGWFARLFGGEDAETQQARQRMAHDRRDPRRAFAWGIVAASYEIDPAYTTAHATEAITQWYGVKSADDLLTYSPARFGTNDFPGYNQYRLCFLARAGFGAGMLSEAQSWDMAIRQAAVLHQHYRSWQEFGQGYMDGHLQYRASQGDAPAQLAQYRASIQERLALKQRDVWSAIPWATPL